MSCFKLQLSILNSQLIPPSLVGIPTAKRTPGYQTLSSIQIRERPQLQLDTSGVSPHTVTHPMYGSSLYSRCFLR